MLRVVGGLAVASLLFGCGNPGPALMADTDAPLIRVLLGTPRVRDKVTVRDQSWTLTGRTLRETGRSTFAGTWQATPRGIAIDGRPTGEDALRLTPAKHLQVGSTWYAGALLVTRKGKHLEFVNELDLETYVAGVIGHELGPGAAPAAHRAQAVAARTYAYQRIQGPDAAAKPFHVYDTHRSQVYGGLQVPASFGVRFSDMVRAVGRSRGVILTYSGRPIHAYYSSSCGGHTTDAATSQLDAGHAGSPLRGVPCPHCRTSKHYTNKYFQWMDEASEKSIATKLKARGQGITLPIHDIQVRERGRGGWAKSVAITYGPTRRVKVVRGTTFRTVARLRSHNIGAIEAKGPGLWRVAGRGWGHGVGMCQVGAINMAHRGATETEILRYYYPGISFTRVY